MERFFLLILFLSHVVFAEESQEEGSLVDQIKSPIARVAGSVNVISGSFVDQATHSELSGPDPYVVAHSYASMGGDWGSLADCWDFYHPSKLVIDQPTGLAFYPRIERSPATICYREAGGSVLVFKGDEKAQKFSPRIEKIGYVRMNSIGEPSRRDARRVDLWRDSPGNYWTMRLGDGTIRVYGSVEKKRGTPLQCEREFFHKEYHIIEETFPSGNKRTYFYHRDHKLSEIHTKSSKGKLLHAVFFEWGKHHVTVKTSDNKKIRFSLDKPHDIWPAVTEIERSGKPKLVYKYSKEKKVMVEEKRSSSGAVEQIEYNRKKGPFCSRVKALKTKMFSADKPFCSHRFKYKIWKEFTRTRVYEEDGAKKTYFWDVQKRPVWVGSFSPGKKLLRAERFFWGTGKDEGRLITRILLDEQRRPLISKKFFYDEQGNVIKEKLRGSFTGRPHTPLSYDKDKKISGGEKCIKEAKYNSRNLKVSETNPLGDKIYYEYEDKRDLLTARFTCSGNQIIKREFFTYDDAAIKTKSITDDGSSRKKNHMTSVTKRIIKQVRIRQKTPRYGIPEEESEYVWTPNGGKKLFRKKVYEHDRSGRIICESTFDTTQALVKRVTYTYDDEDRVTRRRDTIIGHEERFTYDGAGRLASKSTPEKVITYKYDLFDRAIEEKTTYSDGSSLSSCHEYDRSGRIETVVDGRGRTTTMVRDIVSRQIKKNLPIIPTEEGSKRPEDQFFYSGLAQKHMLPTGACEEVIRSGLGKPLVSTNAYGAKTYCFYDLKGRLVEQQDPSGLTTIYEYDALDRVIKVTQKAGQTVLSEVAKRYQGLELIEESLPTKKILYSYDGYGRKCGETTIDLVTQQKITKRFAYDAQHRVTHVMQEELGIDECIVYDGADREVERKVFSSSGELLSLTTKKYDLAGRIIEEGVGRSGTIARTETTWGAFGLVASVTQPDGTKTFFSYNPLHRAEDGSFYFKKVTTDARGVVTEELLDANNVPVFTTIKDSFGTVVSRKRVFVSLLGKPSCIVENIICQGEEAGAVTTRLEYDCLGRTTGCTLASGEKEEATWRYSYDAVGRKIEEQKPSGMVLKTIYDEKGRVRQYKSSDGTISWQYTYNVQDLPETIFNDSSGASTGRSYDGLGHIIKETFESGSTLFYDVIATGQISAITYPDGSRTSFSYKSGRLASIERKGYVHTILERDVSGYITKAELGSLGVITQSIDSMGRKTSVSHASFSEERTKFDPIGLCLERTIDSQKEVFSYDALSQLTSDNGRSAKYDSLYRRVEHNGRQASHNARHQILEQGDQKFIYNADGCRTRDSQFSYTYDALDRLIAFENDVVRTEYAYDAFHRRILTKNFVQKEGVWEQTSSENYLWQGESEIGSIDSLGAMRSLRILGEGLGGDIGASILFELNGQSYVPLHDLSGNVRVLLTLLGEVAENISYTAFGIEKRTCALSPWTFSSKREDASGFIYFGRRYYDMDTGSWLTQDPLGCSAGPNLYAYVKNNPLTMFDLFGLIEESGGGGFWSSVWDGICSVFSGSSDSSSSSSISSRDPASTQCSSDRPQEESGRRYSNFMRHDLGEGYVAYTSRDANDQLVVHHLGLDFFEENQGRNLNKQWVMFDNGMCMTLERCGEIAHRTLHDHDRLVAFISVYNGTRGFVRDAVEAAGNVAHLPMQVVHTSVMTTSAFFDKCLSHGITGTPIRVGWSQGVAIAEQRYSLPQYQPGGRYFDFMGPRASFGGAVLSKEGPNFIASGDCVPWIFPGNWPALIAPDIFGYDVQWLDRVSVGSPHDFSGPEYKAAFDGYLREQLGER